ncbi:hypothetical protein AVEN_9214-1 [Araneus ventricosus]|uniref:Phospholipase A2-like domain-containing protein n=1 Tax=Araneus ventricosus TaxID=182803 RepID=A0A4Y2JRF3_ARAVE|nr:hypothetical protein AVEN_9214-1 [Araneus ventricosus]
MYKDYTFEIENYDKPIEEEANQNPWLLHHKFRLIIIGKSGSGPGTQLLWGKHRLNDDLTYKDSGKPINRVDEAAYHHDVCYLKNKNTKTRNEVCDANMLKELDDIENPSIRERIEKGLLKQLLKIKKDLEWELTPP